MAIKSFWTAAKDAELQRLEAEDLSAAQISKEPGTTRNAVIGRSVRLRGLIFPSQLRRKAADHAGSIERALARGEKEIATVGQMRRNLDTGVLRKDAISVAANVGVTLRAIGEELRVSRQRIHQILKN